MEFLQSIIVGLISGWISSWLVSHQFKKKAEESLQRQRFLSEQQEYARYLQRIRVQMHICLAVKGSDDCSALIMEIENAPIVESFKCLNQEQVKVIEKANEAINKVRKQAELGDAGEPHVYHEYAPTLLKCVIAVLKFPPPKMKRRFPAKLENCLEEKGSNDVKTDC